MEEWLSERAGRRVKILVPQRGDKRALVELATRNAELSYRTRFNEITAAHFDALETLRTVIGLPSLPRRIASTTIVAATSAPSPTGTADTRTNRLGCVPPGSMSGHSASRSCSSRATTAPVPCS